MAKQYYSHWNNFEPTEFPDDMSLEYFEWEGRRDWDCCTGPVCFYMAHMDLLDDQLTDFSVGKPVDPLTRRYVKNMALFIKTLQNKKDRDRVSGSWQFCSECALFQKSLN